MPSRVSDVVAEKGRYEERRDLIRSVDDVCNG
jgi:hypothetical protein